MQWIPRQTPLYIRKSEGCRAIHYFLISAIKIVGTRSNRLSEAVTEAFRTCTINDLRRNKKGIKIFPLKILFGKMQCIWIDMFSLWGKSGVCWGVHYFLISALKHRLWVLVRTDTSLRRFERVPIGQTWGIRSNTSQMWTVWPNSTKLSHIQQNTSHVKNPTEFLTPIFHRKCFHSLKICLLVCKQ